MGLLAVGVGGFLGASLRYGFNVALVRWAAAFPFATLLSNVLAAIAIGFLIGLEQQRGTLEPHLRLFLMTGVLGGLSTFSTFSLETVSLFQSERYLAAFGNVLLNLAICFAGVVFGAWVARLTLASSA